MMRFSIVGVLILTVLAASRELSAQSVAGRTARTVVTFDNVGDVPGVPEGITTDGKDGLYVSLFVLDQIGTSIRPPARRRRLRTCRVAI